MIGFHFPWCTICCGFLAVLFGFACCSSLQATIRYEVSLAHPEQHLFHVTMTIPDVDDEVIGPDSGLERALSDSRL